MTRLPGTPSPKPPLGRRARWIIILFCLVGALCLAAFILTPRHIETRGLHSDLVQVSILRPALADARPWILLAGVILPLVAAIQLLARGRTLLGAALLVLTLACSFVAAAEGTVTSLGPWTIYDRVTAADGMQYCFIDSSFLQGQTMAIARPRSTGLLYQKLDVLGTTNGDSPRSYLLIVRPAAVRPGQYGILYSTPAGLLVGLRHGNSCYLAYDIANQRFYGHGDVEKLSPFLLLDAATPLNAADTASILQAISANDMGQPTRESLTEALPHPNPAVRQAASTLLSTMKP